VFSVLSGAFAVTVGLVKYRTGRWTRSRDVWRFPIKTAISVSRAFYKRSPYSKIAEVSFGSGDKRLNWEFDRTIHKSHAWRDFVRSSDGDDERCRCPLEPDCYEPLFRVRLQYDRARIVTQVSYV